AEKHIVLDDLLIKRMVLPKTLVNAIEKKLAQKQKVMEYDYRLQKEVKEARRKAIEAEGIKRFQEIVKSAHFFEKYLQFKGIEATVTLAQSNNSKIIIIGSGKRGLPVIFNLDASTPSYCSPKENLSELNKGKGNSPIKKGVKSKTVPSLHPKPCPLSSSKDSKDHKNKERIKDFLKRLMDYLGTKNKPSLLAPKKNILQKECK
ncbi:MAG: hypothetical protein DRG39_06620, partial [Deltaproteobacteria bacterium]